MHGIKSRIGPIFNDFLFVCVLYVRTTSKHTEKKIQSYFYIHLLPVFCPGIHMVFGIMCIKMRCSAEDIEWNGDGEHYELSLLLLIQYKR